MSDARKLFIHCGLHKTGTTALQRLLGDRAAQLTESGLYLPQAFSKTRGAHHALAHCLRGPWAYDRHAATFDQLRAEFAAVSSGDCCVSSEDFETILCNEAALCRLKDLATGAGLRPVCVVYLRNQAAYFESLYLQMLAIGLNHPAADCLDEIVRTGRWSWRKWVFQFDYDAIAATLSAAGFDLILRDYSALDARGIAADFFDCIGRSDLACEPMAEGRVNASRKNQNIRRFVRNAIEAGAYDKVLTGALDKMVVGRMPRLSAEARSRLASRVGPGNAELDAQWGLCLQEGFNPEQVAPDAPLLERMFSKETLDAVSGPHLIKDAVQDDKLDRFRADWFAAC